VESTELLDIDNSPAEAYFNSEWVMPELQQVEELAAPKKQKKAFRKRPLKLFGAQKRT